MFNFSPEQIFSFLARVPVLFFAISVHEFAHAWTAVRCGDPTPEQQGRLTLNPLAHFDPIGALFILFMPIGWGKPVLINPANFRDPSRDQIWVSAAGPLSNIAQAIVYSLLFPFVLVLGVRFLGREDQVFNFLVLVCFYGVFVNIALAVFNMIPIFPLDGEKVLVHSLPLQKAMKVAQLRRYGISILLLLLLLSSTPVDPLGWWLNTTMAPFLAFLQPGEGWLSQLLLSILT